MRALVVSDSLYGNTRHIAQAIAEGLRVTMDAQALPVADVAANATRDVQFIVVGAPTHAWSLSRQRTREAAATDLAKFSDRRLPSRALATGVREWMRTVDRPVTCRAAAFDTRLDRPRLFTGSAVRAIVRGLHAVGFELFGEPHSFRVRGTTGPLAFGEIERAREWGEAMGRAVTQLAPLGSPQRAASQ